MIERLVFMGYCWLWSMASISLLAACLFGRDCSRAEKAGDLKTEMKEKGGVNNSMSTLLICFLLLTGLYIWRGCS